MTWHNDAINPTVATALLIAAGALALVTLTEAIRRNQKATKFNDLKGPAVWYLSAIAVAVGVPLFLISTAKLFETLLTNNPGDVRWISLLFLSIVGAPFVIWRSFVAQAQADTAAQGMITDRINKAVEGLGAEKTVKRPVQSSDGTLTYEEATEPNLEVRVGAVLALERIAKDSPDDHIQIMEILCAYIRENACIVNIGSEGKENWEQRVDTQTAVTVIGRRHPAAIEREKNRVPQFRVDLSNANLQRANMYGGNFAYGNFENAKLVRANFEAADLTMADLRDANLELSYFWEANLSKATFLGANLCGANFGYATVREADFRDCPMTRARLICVDFTEADIFDPLALDETFGIKSGFGVVRLPDQKPPKHWLASKAEEGDTTGLIIEFYDGLEKWADNPLPKK
ncbi:MAG: pentapeptide repeat-containing protein [Pseudomonadota bacterium]